MALSRNAANLALPERLAVSQKLAVSQQAVPRRRAILREDPESGPESSVKLTMAGLISVAIVIGAVSGLVAVALYGGVDIGTRLLLGGIGYHPATVAGDKGGFHPTSGPTQSLKWLLPLLTAGGALVATTIVYLIAPESHGHGTDNAIKAINEAPTGIRARVLPVRLIASVVTIGSGGSGGTEGPTAQMAATTASVIAARLNLNYEQARKLVTAGLASGVGAIFRAPLGGAVLGAELLFRDDADVDMLVPSMVSSSVAYLVFCAVFGFSPMFGHLPGLTMQWSAQLIAFPLVGLCAGALARLFCWVFYAVAERFDNPDRPRKWQRRRPLRAAGAGLVVGVIGLYVPGVLGTGYGTIQDVLSPQHVLSLSIVVLLAMPLAKIAATALTVGSGGSAGVFGPSLVIGATAGAALWRLLHPLGLAPSAPAALVIIGMAACLGAAAHAPVAITLIAAEACGSISLLEPAVIAVPIAMLIMGKQTLYHSQPPSRRALEQLLAERQLAALSTAEAQLPREQLGSLAVAATAGDSEGGQDAPVLEVPGSGPAPTAAGQQPPPAGQPRRPAANPQRTRSVALNRNKGAGPIAPVSLKREECAPGLQSGGYCRLSRGAR